MTPPKRRKDRPAGGLKLRSIWDAKQLLESGVDPDRQAMRKLYKALLRDPHAGYDAIDWVKIQLPKKIETIIKSDFHVFTTTVVEQEESHRGDTTKLLVELQDGHRIETVVMRHKGHSTVCVSSEIGCRQGCKFCATGTLGIIGELSAGEIIEQFVLANAVSKIRNIVYMGMGEPLNNYENVKLSVQFLVVTVLLHCHGNT
jgi:adenine C2-methylase RlmN of 23S rRNA A2503 and tRNA A37